VRLAFLAFFLDRTKGGDLLRCLPTKNQTGRESGLFLKENEMKHIENYTVRWHDTDAGREIRPTALLALMQETSNLQFYRAGRSLDALRDSDGVGFILSRIAVDMLTPLYAYDDIRVETFTCPSRGYASTRGFRVLAGDEVVAEADTLWALVDINSKNLKKIDESGYAFDDEEPPALDLPTRTRAPSSVVMEQVATRTIRYSDIDYNMHMNNTRYPDMLCDYMPIDRVGDIRGMTLSYLHEAALSDTLTVFRGESDGVYYFKTVNSAGQTCLEAVVCCRPSTEK
jgi:acyl-ACP thioesterase